MVKTAILLGGYARSGKSTAMRYLGESIPTVSTSQELIKHVKLLIPYLSQFDFTSDEAKAMLFPASTAYVTTLQMGKSLAALGYPLDYYYIFDIYKYYYLMLKGKLEISIRDICISVAESTRLAYPNIYVDLALKQTLDHNLIVVETTGGKESDHLYRELKTKGYQVVGQNIRRKTELAGVDIRELIKFNQCDILNRDIHNNHSKKYLIDELDLIILSIRDE